MRGTKTRQQKNAFDYQRRKFVDGARLQIEAPDVGGPVCHYSHALVLAHLCLWVASAEVVENTRCPHAVSFVSCAWRARSARLDLYVLHADALP